MMRHPDKIGKANSGAIANSTPIQRATNKKVLQLVDNRSSTAAQLKLQKMADTSLRQRVIQCVFDEEDFGRPSFRKQVYFNAKMGHNLKRGQAVDYSLSTGLEKMNASVPHRMSWLDIRTNTLLFLNATEDATAFERWTDRLIEAGNGYISYYTSLSGTGDESHKEQCNLLLASIREQTVEFKKARKELIKAMATAGEWDQLAAAEAFFEIANSYYPNVPDLGQHKGNNLENQEAPHTNYMDDGSTTPGSSAVFAQSPHRLSAFAQGSDGLLTGTWGPIDKANLSAPQLAFAESRPGKAPVTVHVRYEPYKNDKKGWGSGRKPRKKDK